MANGHIGLGHNCSPSLQHMKEACSSARCILNQPHKVLNYNNRQNKQGGETGQGDGYALVAVQSARCKLRLGS